MKAFILRNDNSLKRIKQGLYIELTSLDLSKPKQVSITNYKEDKTGEQRNWWHVLLGLFGDEVGYTKVQMKRVILSKVYGTEIILGVEVSVSSESLKRDDYSKLIEQTYIEAAQMGIQLPSPFRKG